MILQMTELEQKLAADSSLKLGCIIDTNVLFAASFPLDSFNEWAEKVFAALNSMGIPIFANINIRSEFIELNRRVLIPECLMDFYEIWAGQLDSKVANSLKSLKTRMDTASAESRGFKLTDNEIKRYRSLLNDSFHVIGTPSWEKFCEVHLWPFIKVIWAKATDDLKIQFLGTRAIESKDFFNADPKWSDMLDIVGKSGIGTSDAMIVNLFLKSKLPLIVTADSDVRDTVISMMSQSKYVLAPS